MIRAIKAVSSERGRDPRGFTLFALGGNGALFAAGMARELGIRTILVPPSAGLFSAYGLLHADVEHYYTEPVRKLLRDVDGKSWMDSWSRLETKAREQLAEDGFADEEIEIRRSANMRYKGQTFEISVALPAGPLTPTRLREIEGAFGSEHERSYGHRATLDEPIQLTSIQVGGLAVRQGSQRPGRPERHAGDVGSRNSSRKAYFGREYGWLDTAILSRSDLKTPVEGPCIVEEYDTTCVVPPGTSARLDARGNIIISMD
jgi:N-methylhydantoinase A